LTDSYYAIYTVDGDFTNPVASYSLSKCDATDSEYVGLCPVNAESTYCPCLPVGSTEVCQSMGCEKTTVNSTTTTVTDAACVSFTAADVSNCYCSGVLDNMIATNGVMGVISWLGTYMMGTQDFSDECTDTQYYFSASMILLYVAIIITYFTNKLLKNIVLRNAKAEHHISFDELDRAVASRIFFATYFNMAIVILLAYGFSTETAPTLTDNYIFSGPYRDFDKGWYGMVGFYLVITFIIMNFPQFFNKYYDFYISNRFLKFSAYKEAA
jgi:hypothetical protein